MKLSKLVIAAGAAAALAAAGGCSSKVDEKQPKLAGPENPNLKIAGRGAGGPPGKTAGQATGAPVKRD